MNIKIVEKTFYGFMEKFVTTNRFFITPQPRINCLSITYQPHTSTHLMIGKWLVVVEVKLR